MERTLCTVFLCLSCKYPVAATAVFSSMLLDILDLFAHLLNQDFQFHRITSRGGRL
jgi:hypothetical protein